MKKNFIKIDENQKIIGASSLDLELDENYEVTEDLIEVDQDVIEMFGQLKPNQHLEYVDNMVKIIGLTDLNVVAVYTMDGKV